MDVSCKIYDFIGYPQQNRKFLWKFTIEYMTFMIFYRGVYKLNGRLK